MSRAKRFMVTALALLGFAALGALSPAPARALTAAPVTQFAACDAGTFFGFPTWYSCLPKDATGHPVVQKLEDLWLIAFPLLESGIKLAGYTAVGFVIWGGIRFIKSQGNAGEITAARDTIRDALIGLVICISAVAIVQFLANRI